MIPIVVEEKIVFEDVRDIVSSNALGEVQGWVEEVRCEWKGRD